MDGFLQRRQGFAHLYYAKIPKHVAAVAYPIARAEYVAAARSQVVRNQRAFAWQLLLCAMEHSLGVNPQTVDFTVENGVWSCAECCFSLSHTAEYAAVALSDTPIGVDVEQIARFDERLFDRIATSGERGAASFSPLNTALLWTGKEALFKQRGGRTFVPHAVDTSRGGIVSFADEQIVISVATTASTMELFCADGNNVVAAHSLRKISLT